MVARSRVLLTVVALLAGLLVSVPNAMPAAAANNQSKPLSQTAVVTNNIQGSTGGTDSKWGVTVRGLIQTNDIVLLQEAGPSGPPGSAEQTPIVRNGNTIRHFEWTVGAVQGPSRGNGVALAQVYYLQTDNFGGTGTGGRVNIAIVTRDLPDDFMVVTNPNQAGRAALGVRFGTTWYFTIHGLSYGGPVNDSQDLLDAIDTNVDSAGAAAGVNYSYTVGGDFNVEPAQLAGSNGLGIPPGSRIINSNRATQQSGRELDYFVSDDPTSAPVLSNGRAAQRLNGAQADHYAVRMGALQAAAEPPSLKVMFQANKCVGCDSSNGLLYKSFGVLMAATIAAAASLGLKRSVDFVGDDTSTSGDGTPQEGAAGEQIGVDASQDTTAIPKYLPNVVMLQAGTQDLLNGNQSSAPDQLSALIDQIQAADPTVVVMVAILDPMANATDESLVTAYNTSVQQLVAAKVAAGRRVVLADMSDLTTADLNADGVTPNSSGQQKIADAFTSALLDAEVLGWLTEPVSASAPGGSVCDIYAYYGTACVGAYSMTRAMYSDYDGPLYQVQRASDGATADIGVSSPGGDVDASQQDSFCAGTTCKVSVLYDQSPQLNNLTTAPGGGANPTADQAADATALPITVAGKKAYGLDITPGTGYRYNNTRGIATGSEPEGTYMVASGTHVNSGCCMDFGNAEANSHDNGNGHMDAVNLGTNCYYQSVAPCSGGGPWVAADMENGLFQGGNGSNPANKGNPSNFVTAMLKNNGTSTYALKGGDAQTGGLSTWWNGGLPNNVSGYIPMQKEGGIILGIGGDNSNASAGSFFEGVMTDGYPSDAADNAVQANIVSAGYGGNSGGTLPPATSASAAGAAVVHDGYASVYSVDSANGHLRETYLPKLGGPWYTQDLTNNYHTPTVLPGTTPVSLVHDGYTSVYTVDASNGHLQETYLPKLGGPWYTQDLSNNYHTPATSWTPTAVVHDGYTSVYTVDSVNGHLRETYLPKLGGPWYTQDLSDNYHTPQVQAGTSPVSIVHSGYTSVYTVDPDHHLQETYLPKLGGPWYTQDLTNNYHTPPTSVTPTAVVHQGYTSVYTVDDGNNHLQETYLPAMGDPWSTQDLSANYKTPSVAPGTQPVALLHTGYTSVYTVDEASQHVQETYLSAVGQSWSTQDFTAKYGTPVTVETPVVLVHPASGGDLWTGVYTTDEFNDHLQETYLPAIGDSWTSQDLSAKYNTPAVAASGSSAAGWAVVHDGYTSVYTVAANSNDLLESYLPAMGQPWTTQDLTSQVHNPPVMPGTKPVALTHDGYTSVYTIDGGSGDLQETYLPKLGGPWYTQDLTKQFHTPTSTVTPTAIFHSGYTSVYTVDESDGDLDETYLPAIGGPWTTQDLSKNYGTPTVSVATSPVAILHSGWTSVYTVGPGGDLEETYLNAIGGSWVTQDLSKNYGTPAVAQFKSPTAVVHNGYTSVYTVDFRTNHLQETYLPAIGDAWVSQDLTQNYGTQPVATGSENQITALYHTGFTSVYTVDNNGGDLRETYLPAIGDSWGNQDLTQKYGTPAPGLDPGPTALLHYDTSGGLTWTSVFSIDGKPQNDLQETYLPAIGDNWTTQDLTQKYPS